MTGTTDCNVDEKVEQSGEEKKELSHNREIGRRGEDAAARFLERRGYDILERNWTCEFGEADIIARNETAIVFVEVKTRTDEQLGLPEEAVGPEKRKRYERIAAAYLRDNDTSEVAIRFDIIAILVIATDRALVRHHINAWGVV
jgi:putative endonuclease